MSKLKRRITFLYAADWMQENVFGETWPSLSISPFTFLEQDSFCITGKTAAEGDGNWQDLQCQSLVGSVENSQANVQIKGAAVTQSPLTVPV